jgi:hypothetical protein
VKEQEQEQEQENQISKSKRTDEVSIYCRNLNKEGKEERKKGRREGGGGAGWIHVFKGENQPEENTHTTTDVG